MALKRLTTEEMVAISGPWTTKGTSANKALLAVPELEPLLARLAAAHQGLHAAQPVAESPRLATLMAEEAQIDARHDTVVRGVNLVLTGLALLAGDGAAGDGLNSVLAFLLPDGVDAIQGSYRTEAGAAALLKARLGEDASTKKQLKAIPVLKKTLGDYVNEWIASAERLGTLEDEKAKLLGAVEKGDGTRMVTARNQWIRIVNALVANGEMAELDKATDLAIFGPLRLTEKKADRRVKAPAEADPGAAGPAPADVTGSGQA